MKTYFYVYRRFNGAPSHKHETLESAVAESQRLAARYPSETFEILQCVALTSAPKPQASTFYLDGIESKDERHVGFPDGMMLPEIPDGYRHAIYRGEGWKSGRICKFGFDFTQTGEDWETGHGYTCGSEGCYYCEFIK